MSLVLGQHVVDWIAKQTNPNGYFGNGTGIGWERAGALVGGIAYMNWNGVNIDVHVASNGSRRWISPRLLEVAFDYPFIQLGVRRITAEIGEGNADSRSFAEHLGFILEGKKKDAHPTGALCIYKMTPATCRFIKPRVLNG